MSAQKEEGKCPHGKKIEDCGKCEDDRSDADDPTNVYDELDEETDWGDEEE